MLSDISDRIENTMTPEELSRLESAKTHLSDRQSLNLKDLVIGWASHVVELRKHTETGSGDLPYWGAHDLVAAVSLRTFTETAYTEIDDELRTKFDPILTEVDNEFLSFTEHDDFGCVEAVDGMSKPDRGWWWHRIPTHGPIREDIREICQHVHHH
ncbi:hypothetical protein EKD16_11035 [Streptomonospora litoralis]|uniref:Uncharacterized protein n=2 Tax=Streptomonospora litoralis TaxID=2498135 RepID=A0A4V0ZJM4_9ACTN|nr:hypothetical protein EKD16_11035 [Streptomonospora litoralis]